MDLGLRQGNRASQYIPLAVSTNTAGYQYSGIQYLAAPAHFLVPGVEQNIPVTPQFALTPGLQKIVKCSRSPRYLH
jgi:hypothetical protein